VAVPGVCIFTGFNLYFKFELLYVHVFPSKGGQITKLPI
jgi:hypothetical protein